MHHFIICEIFIRVLSLKCFPKNSVMSSSLTSDSENPRILNVALQHEIIINSKTIVLKLFNSLKSKMSKRKRNLSSNFASENKTKPENNSNESMRPFLSVSQRLNNSSLFSGNPNI